jgi:hypothetical protein
LQRAQQEHRVGTLTDYSRPYEPPSE